MSGFIVGVFLLVYLGMILGGLPLVQLDRTGVAVLGAIALVATDAVTVDEARQAIHTPTIALLFAFMVIAAQLRMSGFFAWAARRLGTLAGNLLIVGSIANIIVVQTAQQRGIAIGWGRHASVGIPVTLATLGVTATYLWLAAGLL
jgi:Na+/H+ antiporter NhaD/arsenite permease-like protein